MGLVGSYNINLCWGFSCCNYSVIIILIVAIIKAVPEIISGTYQCFLVNDCFIKSNPLVKIPIHNSYQNSILIGCYSFILSIKMRATNISDSHLVFHSRIMVTPIISYLLINPYTTTVTPFCIQDHKQTTVTPFLFVLGLYHIICNLSTIILIFSLIRIQMSLFDHLYTVLNLMCYTVYKGSLFYVFA